MNARIARTATLNGLLILFLAVDAAAQAPKRNYPRLSAELAAAVEAADAGVPLPLGPRPGLVTFDTLTAVSIRVSDTDIVAAWLEARGVRVSNLSTDTLEAYAPLDTIRQLNAAAGVLRVSPVRRPQPRVVGQGAAAHNATAWHAGGFTGTGVRVGIIDLGFIGFSGLMGTDLPSTVTVRCYTAIGVHSPTLANCQTDTNHGTGVAEALIDIAPNVQLFIANPISALDFRSTVDWMTSQGVRIINFSAAWTWDGPGNGTSPFSDSPLVTADAAVAGGALFVSAAGNEGRSTWWGPFVDTDMNSYAEFGSSRPDDNAVTLQAGQRATIQLRWDDSWTAAARDIDLEVYDSDGFLIAFSNDSQAGSPGDIPFEFVSFTAQTTGTYYVAVLHYSGARPSWMQLQMFTSETLEFFTARSIASPAESANPGVMAVGAARWSTPNTIEAFSSQGPTPDGRTKPEIVGVDGADSATFGPGAFFGTSQATPHVAGLGALVLQAFTPFTPSQVATYLKTNASPRGAVPNNTWGFGLARVPDSPCTFGLNPLSALFHPAGGSSNVVVTTTPGCAWTAVSGSGFVTVTSGMAGNGSGAVGYTVAANAGGSRTGTITIAGQTFSIYQSGAGPTMSLDKTAVNFGAVWSGGSFSSMTLFQQLRLTQSGPGSVTWTATPAAPWISVSALSGSGPAVLTVDVIPHASLPASGLVTSTIRLVFTGAANATILVSVNLNLFAAGTSTAPTGSIETPLNNATNLAGALGFTGWALDDIEMDKIAICRNPVPPETASAHPLCGGAAQIFVGFAPQVEGARPDVAAAFPTSPNNTKAGFGLMVLSNMLPNQGNGTYTFSIYLSDREGNVVLLGTRTITCNNAGSILPFGTIDVPDQGGVVSGTFFNFGWALTPQPKLIPTDGSTIVVFIDGVPVGNPTYNQFRADIAALFPGLQNTNGAIGAFAINTMTLTNGVHTIAWSVTDNQGAAAGLGSRYFAVSNGSSMTEQQSARSEIVNQLPTEKATMTARRGWDLRAPLQKVDSSQADRSTVEGDELGRVELRVGTRRGVTHAAYLRVGKDLASLPIGAQLNTRTGEFTWTPGVGFIGAYDLVFVQYEGGRAKSRREVRVVLNAKGSGPTNP